MADIAQLSIQPRPAGGNRPDGYQAVREVRARAAVSNKTDTPESIAQVIRLNKILAKGEPLNADVPRGYYLNFTV